MTAAASGFRGDSRSTSRIKPRQSLAIAWNHSTSLAARFSSPENSMRSSPAESRISWISSPSHGTRPEFLEVVETMWAWEASL